MVRSVHIPALAVVCTRNNLRSPRAYVRTLSLSLCLFTVVSHSNSNSRIFSYSCPYTTHGHGFALALALVVSFCRTDSVIMSSHRRSLSEHRTEHSLSRIQSLRLPYSSYSTYFYVNVDVVDVDSCCAHTFPAVVNIFKTLEF